MLRQFGDVYAAELQTEPVTKPSATGSKSNKSTKKKKKGKAKGNYICCKIRDNKIMSQATS